MGMGEDCSGSGKISDRCVDVIVHLHNFSIIVSSSGLLSELAGEFLYNST